ncbi:MAG: DUF6531 domain-containing protein [Thermoleophilia bacterium]
MSASVAVSHGDNFRGHLRRFFFGLALFFSALLFLLFCFYPEGRAQTDPGNFLLGVDSPVAPDNTDQRSPAISGSIALWSEDSAGVFYKDLSRGPDEPKHALIDGDGGGGWPVYSQSAHRAVWTEWVYNNNTHEMGTTLYYKDVDLTNYPGCTGGLAACATALPVSAGQFEPIVYTSLSPDGSKVVWQQGAGNYPQIFLYKFGDIGPQQVSPAINHAQFKPSVDSNWVVWTENWNLNDMSWPLNSAVYAKKIGTADPPILIDGNSSDNPSNTIVRDARLGHDATGKPFVIYVYADTQAQTSQLLLYDLETGTRYHLMEGDGAYYNPDLDAGSAVVSVCKTSCEIDLMDIASSAGQQTVSMTPGGDVPRVSASSHYVIWQNQHDHPYQIFSNQMSPAYMASLGMDMCGACGDPVKTSTGAFVHQDKDIEIPTKGLPLEFTRTYNSNDPEDHTLGRGWSFNWQTSVRPYPNGNVVVLRGDGRQDVYTLNTDGSYSPYPGKHDVLTRNADGTFKLVTLDQTTYNFNSDNNLASEVAQNGQAITLGYNTSKQLTQVTASDGRVLSLDYNPDGRIDHVTEPLSQTVSFGYTGGDLTSVTGQNSNTTTYSYQNEHITGITDPENHTSANNIYDDKGRVTEQRDAENHLLSFDYSVPGQTRVTRQMGAAPDPAKDEVTTYYYDSQYRLTRETDALGKVTLYTYDSYGNRDSVTDRRGTVTKEIFDPFGNVTDIYKAMGAPEEEHTHYTYNAKNHPLTKTDPRGQTTGYTYDSSGTYLTQVNYPAVTNYDGSVSNYSESFTYNPDGTRATHTDANGDITSYSYDSKGYPQSQTRNTNQPLEDQVALSYVFDDLGRKTQETDGDGHVTDYQYDGTGNLRYLTKYLTDAGQSVPVVTQYIYDKAGNRVETIDPENKHTSFTYTPTGRLSKITDAYLHTIEYTYDAAGNKEASKDRNDKWSSFTFDKDNRMISSKDEENYETTYGYDEEANQTSVTDPLTHATTKTYDRINRLASVSQLDENGVARTTSYGYDAADHLTSTTDPLTHTSSNVYDELGRLRQSTDALGNSTYTAYDGAGNTVKMKDALGHETIYGYSPSDFLTSVTDPMGGVTRYGYDKEGDRTSQTDAEGHTTLYGYDELGRITSEKVDAGSNSYLLEKSYTYDKSGHLTSDVTGEGTISYAYNDLYDLTSVADRQSATYSYTYDNNQNQLTATDNAQNRTVSFTYNPRGLLSSSTDAFGATENFTYDGAGNLTGRHDTIGTGFDTSFTYTPRNQLASVTRGSDTSNFNYDAAGNLSYKHYPNGILSAYNYDADNRVTSMEAIKNNGVWQQWFSQGYDANGNIVQKSESTGLYGTSYGYDPLNRLTSENIGGYGTISYGYDRAGNRTSLSNPTTGQTSYSYNEANELTSSVNNGTATDYAYNANGAITGKTTGSDTTNYSYNGMDELTSVATPSSTVNYAYDALGRRVQRIEGSDTRNIHLQAKTDLPDYWSDGSGNITASLLRGADGLISFTLDPVSNPNLSYQLFSPHGDTTMIMDTAGNPFFTARYDAFGDAISGSGLWYGYTGKYQRYSDSSTGTIEMGVREYDPSLGRFIAADPLKGTPTDPQQRNRYPYVGNDPLTKYDLSGYEVSLPWQPPRWLPIPVNLAEKAQAAWGCIAAAPECATAAVAAAPVVVVGVMVEKKLSGESDREQAYLYSQNMCLIPDPESGIHWGPGGYVPGLAATQNGTTVQSALRRDVSPELARKLGIPYKQLSDAVHRAKDGITGNPDIEIDDETGNVYVRRPDGELELLDNAYDKY